MVRSIRPFGYGFKTPCSSGNEVFEGHIDAESQTLVSQHDQELSLQFSGDPSFASVDESE